MIQLSYASSFRELQRPERGRITETVVCGYCGAGVSFRVFSVAFTRRVRALWLGLLLLLAGLSMVPFPWLATVAGILPFKDYMVAMPEWLLVTLVAAGMLSLRVVFFCHFYWSDEFGVRTLHRWRYSGSLEGPDEQRGEYVARCVGRDAVWRNKAGQPIE
ncbi:hypothetical protein [Streptomyces phytohabitans]|uniref:hypothetical protein n=1 Tax=Streptomyces phytohabitans TaxID=1150371 RepID=UPI00345BD81A